MLPKAVDVCVIRNNGLESERDNNSQNSIEMREANGIPIGSR
jgi:hypothetical protein